MQSVNNCWNSLHSSGILNYFITDFLFNTYKAFFFQDILGDVICINLFNNCSNHFRCECESCSTMDTTEECICCQAISAVIINMEDGDISCIIEHDIFVANCLNRHVLHISMLGVLRKCGTIR